jgi:hypothetical protein
LFSAKCKINLKLQHADKPPIEELYQFLEFQLPRQWAPVFGDLPLGPEKKPSGASLQFSLMGPKLYVNTNPVMVSQIKFFWFEIYVVNLYHYSDCVSSEPHLWLNG